MARIPKRHIIRGHEHQWEEGSLQLFSYKGNI
jgi:hypothetical protein